MVSRSTPSMYVPLDVNFMRDPRIRRAGPDAEILYVRALAYAKGGETNGMVYDYDLDVIGVGLTKLTARVDRLVTEKAWETRDGGWFICGWFNWNESVEALREKRKKKSEGAAKTNHGKHVDAGQSFKSGCPVCMGEVAA